MAKKKVSYELVKPNSKAGKKVYGMLNGLVEKHHSDLTQSRFAIAWNTAWKEDVDGRITLGKCRRASDLDRELVHYDFVVILNREFWESLEVTDDQRRALLDHELCHAAVKTDDDGEPVVDERDRVVYRIRKHDIEEFEAVVRRHGCYKRDLESFAAALMKRQGNLFPGKKRAAAKAVAEAVEALRPKPGSGIDSVSITDGKGRGGTLHADGRTESIS